MQKRKDITIPHNDLLPRIVNHLLLNGSLLDNLGVCHGKMGIVLFLYHYAQLVNNGVIMEFADELLNEVIDEMHDDLPFDFANGYSGIGWTIEYLLDNHFIEGDSNEILMDIDKKIMEWDVRRITRNDLLYGLEGILHYIVFRLYRCDTGVIFDNEYLESVYFIASKIIQQNKENRISELASKIQLWRDGERIVYHPNDLMKRILMKTDEYDMEITDLDLGLKNGCVGKGLIVIFDEEKLLHNQ